MPEITLRLARPDDLTQLLELYVQLNPVNADIPDDSRVRQVFADLLADPKAICRVATDTDDRLVGSCILVVIPNLTHAARPFGVIENVVTRTELRGQGIGTRLMQDALATAWSADCYKVMLMSGVYRTEAHRFYERLGFRRDTKVGFVATPETAPGV